MEALIRLTTGKSATEFVFSYLVIILSIAESTSFVNTIIITLSCICSFALTIPFIFAFKQRNNEVTEEKYYCRLFLYIAILILVISCGFFLIFKYLKTQKKINKIIITDDTE